MSKFTTLGQALRVFDGHTGNLLSEARTAIEEYGKLAEEYDNMADSLNDAAEDAVSDDESRILLEQTDLVMSIYQHNRDNYRRLLDIVVNVGDARIQLWSVLSSIKELI
jgi:serine/threonine protein phosphatase PrpC